MPSSMNATLPSPYEKFAPPGCRLLNPQCEPGVGGSTTNAASPMGVFSGVNAVRIDELQRLPLVQILLLLIRCPLIVSPKKNVLLIPSMIWEILKRFP